MSKLKYLLVYTLPIITAFAFTNDGAWSWATVIYAFGLLPILDHAFRPNTKNLSPQAAQSAVASLFYDLVLYLIFPVQIAFAFYFILVVAKSDLSTADLIGKTLSMGTMGSVLAINVAHEIGHRSGKLNKFISKALYASVLYSHFYEEHNYGHHRNVATIDDPATARRGEWFYLFVFRSIIFGWIGAFKYEKKRLNRLGKSAFSFRNEVLIWQFLQLLMLVGIGGLISLKVLALFMLASLMSVVILEAINYIEHYGLTRNKVSEFRYEKVNPTHSWNADYVLGRAILFELTRHSDHHETPSKPFQILESPGGTPELPTGYPGMILLSLVPPLFFAVMNKRLDKWCKTS